jgi:hypothetical protein
MKRKFVKYRTKQKRNIRGMIYGVRICDTQQLSHKLTERTRMVSSKNFSPAMECVHMYLATDLEGGNAEYTHQKQSTGMVTTAPALLHACVPHSNA